MAGPATPPWRSPVVEQDSDDMTSIPAPIMTLFLEKPIPAAVIGSYFSPLFTPHA
jgi:hypothetical protein